MENLRSVCSIKDSFVWGLPLVMDVGLYARMQIPHVQAATDQRMVHTNRVLQC